MVGKYLYDFKDSTIGEMHYYYGRAVFTGHCICKMNKDKAYFKVFDTEITQVSNDMETLVKEKEGTENIWVLSDDGPKFLKRI